MRLLTITAMLLILTATVQGDSVQFDPSRGLVEVEAILDGHVKGTFGIDTGADYLYIDREFAIRNRLKLRSASPQRDVVGADGASSGSAISLRSMEVVGERLHNLRATAIDMKNLMRVPSAGHPDGLIGHDILRRFYVTVDYPAQSLTMQMERPHFLNSQHFKTVRFSVFKHLILIDVSINDETTVPMILDYCASYTTFSQELAEELGLDVPEDRFIRMESLELSGGVASSDVPVAVADLSRLKRASPRAEFEGILGGTFLQQHKITVDYKLNRIYVHDPDGAE
jgi:predicted aspartyl protease